MKHVPPDHSRCEAVVYKRDTYRVSRGTKSGFAMHYNRERCSRAAKCDGLCTQHSKQLGYVPRVSK